MVSAQTSAKTWLITGAASGLGQALAAAALARGDRVAGLMRRAEAKRALEAACPERALGVIADVADRAAVMGAVAEAQARFGPIDVLVNNAAQVLQSTVEEATEAAIARLFAINLQGPVNVSQAVLPGMRARRTGRIVNISSAGGIVGLAAIGVYCASKFALEGLTEALAGEVGPLGIHVTLIEPGSFRTNLLAGSTTTIESSIADYEASCGDWRRTLNAMAGREPNDPARFAQAVLALADQDAPPLRLVLGRDALMMVQGKIDSLRRDMEGSRGIGEAMAFDDAAWYAPPPGQSQIS